VLGRVLYVAAHPDDENTRLIAWLQGERHLDTTYLSLTRGGGGQNLVGTEQAELLGVLRTGELLAARSVDGGDQRFTRARDFGYSKSAEEALSLWGHDEVLHDVVRVIREVRPDMIVTRFGPDDRTHGHHIASAVLAAEAFDLAADPDYVTEGLRPWRTRRLLRNESHWRITDDTDTSGWLSVDVGTFSPLRGQSWTEVAAAARTMHKSQGFGSAPTVGPQLEYLSAVAGDVPPPGADPFEGMVLDWSRYPEARAADKALAKAAAAFDPARPHEVLPLLAKAHRALQGVDADGWGPDKLRRLEALMAHCAGLWLTARSSQPAVVPGQPAELTLSAVLRSPASVQLRDVAVGSAAWQPDEALTPAQPWQLDASVPTEGLSVTVPHWLRQTPESTRYVVDDGDGRTAADTPAPLHARFSLSIADVPVELVVPVQHSVTDPVHGERLAPLELLPPATATFGAPTRLVPDGAQIELPVTVRATAGAVTGELQLTAPPGTVVTPAVVPFELSDERPEQLVTVRAQVGGDGGPLRATVEVDGQTSSWSRAVIDHPHLPRRTVLRPATLQLSPVAIDRGGVDVVGYLPGSGDAVPDALRDLGYRVDILDVAAVRSGALADYPVVLVGIRAFNVHSELLESREALYDYVHDGGRLVVQYQTSNRWKNLGDVGPRPLTIGRGRVTDETAALQPVRDDHGVLLGPNELTDDDLQGWVQERGLYFAETFDDAYQPVFRTHDAGEEPLLGSLLVLPHGDGTFVYTGLSFFRQLPAGVPGAARLLANLLAHDAHAEEAP
jgi:LmbE family N-acetylglucosaminyl deacetylase